MNIAINGRFLSQNMTGVQRVAYNFTKELLQVQKFNNLNIKVYSPNEIIQTEYIEELNPIKKSSIKPYNIFWEQYTLPYNLDNNKQFLLNFGNMAPLFGVKNQALMIHDMAFIRHPEWFSNKFVLYYKWLIPKLIKKMKFIMTVSEFSKLEIIHCLKVNPDKIIILPLWLNDYFREQINKPIIYDKDSYILTVSSIEPRKNYFNLLKAFIGMNNQDIALFSAGGISNNFANNLDLQRYEQYSNISFLGRCTDKELIRFYEKALFFCSMSYYEGFGLPALEAMACGCPLLLSDIAAHKEVCGDVAIYANPHDCNDILEKMKLLTNDIDLRNSLIKKGKQRCLLFKKEYSIQKLLSKLQEFN